MYCVRTSYNEEAPELLAEKLLQVNARLTGENSITRNIRRIWRLSRSAAADLNGNNGVGFGLWDEPDRVFPDESSFKGSVKLAVVVRLVPGVPRWLSLLAGHGHRCRR